jgi:hypothetical protein
MSKIRHQPASGSVSNLNLNSNGPSLVPAKLVFGRLKIQLCSETRRQSTGTVQDHDVSNAPKTSYTARFGPVYIFNSNMVNGGAADEETLLPTMVIPILFMVWWSHGSKCWREPHR